MKKTIKNFRKDDSEDFIRTNDLEFSKGKIISIIYKDEPEGKDDIGTEIYEVTYTSAGNSVETLFTDIQGIKDLESVAVNNNPKAPETL